MPARISIRRTLQLVPILIALAVGPAWGQILSFGDMVATGSWSIGLSTTGFAYDEIQWHYRPGDDGGGGKLELPYLGVFGISTGDAPTPLVADPSWNTLAASTPTRAVAIGDRVDGIFGSRYRFRHRIFFDGDATLPTQFDFVFYDDRAWVDAARLHWTGDGSTSFLEGLTRDQFDPGSVIPEPSSLMLLALGLAGAGLRRRRNARR